MDAGVKIDGQDYHEVLRMQKLLLIIKQLSDYFTFQQDSARTHCAKQSKFF